MLGKNLEEILKRKELTVTELAKATNIPRTTLLGLIKGTSSSPNLSQLDTVAQFLSVSIEELAFGRKQKTPDIGEILTSAEVHTGIYRLTLEKLSEKK